jgi:hypothetical protein
MSKTNIILKAALVVVIVIASPFILALAFIVDFLNWLGEI